MKKKIFRLVCVIFLLLIVESKLEADEANSPTAQALNIIVILDTSDRVSKEKNPGQAKKDAIIIGNIVDLFAKLVLSEIANGKRDTWLHHRFAIVVPDQPNMAPMPPTIIEKLKIWPTNEDRSRASAKNFKEMRDRLLVNVSKLWTQIENQKKFTGSDIWDWFRASGEAYLKTNMRNYIICLSDGYLDFDKSIQEKRPRKGNETSYIPYHQIVRFRNDPNWRKKFDDKGHGLLEIGKDFAAYNAKFLMVEAKLRHMQDMEIIQVYWQKWLSSMGITKSEFMRSQPDSQVVKEKIMEFLSQDIEAGL